MKSDLIVVYVCPNPKCDNYYGTSNMGHLDQMWSHNLKHEPTHARSRCPDCYCQRERRYARLISQDEARDALRRVRPEATSGSS